MTDTRGRITPRGMRGHAALLLRDEERASRSRVDSRLLGTITGRLEDVTDDTRLSLGMRASSLPLRGCGWRALSKPRDPSRVRRRRGQAPVTSHGNSKATPGPKNSGR